MDKTWQALQWFDLESSPALQLQTISSNLINDGKRFDHQIIKNMLKSSPFRSCVNIQVLVDQFNDMLDTRHY